MLYSLPYLILSLLLLTSLDLRAQFAVISRIHQARDTANSIYYLAISNPSNDSILVLHTQEAMYPPFINKYKWEIDTKTDSTLIIYLGKTNNTLLPEKYRATKTLPPKGSIQLYFLLPARYDHLSKLGNIYYSMLDEKYYPDFQKLESMGTNAALKRCQSLKQKHGRVFSRKVAFR